MNQAQTWWTPARIAIAIQTLKTYPGYCENARVEISDRLGREVSYDSLQAALRRAGKGPPGSFCQASQVTPSPALDAELAPLEYTWPTDTFSWADQNGKLRVEQIRPTFEHEGFVPGYVQFSSKVGDVVSVPKRSISNIERVALLPDCHRPFHHKVAYPLAIKAIKHFKPDTLGILGDYGDVDSCSSHPKDPSRKYSLVDDIATMNEGLDEIESLGIKRVIFCEANHEYRLRRYIAEKAPELDGIVSIDHALRIAERGWEFVPYRSYAIIGKLHITHDCGYSGMTAAARSRDAFNANVAVGHCHNATITYRGDARGVPRVGFSVGWLGDPDIISYMHKVDTARNWQNGFGLAYIERDTGNCHVHFVPIIDGRCVVEGEIIS